MNRPVPNLTLRTQAYRLLAFTLIAFTLTACRHRPPEAPPAPTPPPPRAVDARVPELPMPDAACLAGRTICLDPGHGGRWPGAVAPSNGLRESDVNLRVSLALQRLLEEAGARVILTRHADESLDANSLSRDLAARAAIANQANADAFVSIHHNADINPNASKNNLEVYYKMGEEGPSLDLAQCFTRALTAFLRRDAEAKLLLPGNFKVLRLAEVPAVLLESSYLTDATNASFLASSDAAEKEATAILAGLAFYFRLDPPVVGDSRVVAFYQGRSHELTLNFERGLPIDPGSVEVRIDGNRTDGEVSLDGPQLAWVFREVLPNGEHTAEVSFRNDNGAAGNTRVPVSVARPPSKLTVGQQPGQVPAGSDVEVLFEVFVQDNLGFPVANGTGVLCETTGTTALTQNGRARFYVSEGGVSESGTTAPMRFQVAGLVTTVDVARAPQSSAQPVHTARIVNALTEAPVDGVVAMSGGHSSVTTPEGWLAVPGAKPTLMLQRNGYRSQTVSLTLPHSEVALAPVADGVLHDRRIVLDPAFGGLGAGVTGPLGTRGSDINLDVAKRAAALLRQGGAHVLLTRSDDSDPSDLLRVAESTGVGDSSAIASDPAQNADIFVTIAFGAPAWSANVLDAAGRRREDLPAFVTHYPSSTNGQRLARAIAQRVGNVPTAPAAAYVIRQTPCPAVWVCPATIEETASEQRMLNVEVRAKLAQGIYDGVLAYFRDQ